MSGGVQIFFFWLRWVFDAECRLSSRGALAQLLWGMWNPQGPGLEPVSPAKAGGPPTTAPPGEPWWSETDNQLPCG